MSTKRKNWMLTIWGKEFPKDLIRLENLDIARLQLEKTKNGIDHWQAFCQFNCQVTLASLREFFKSIDRQAHIGQKKGQAEIKTAMQGIQYVSGYGPLALSKLVDPQQRYIIRNNEILQTPVDDDHMEIYNRLSQPHKCEIIKENAEKISEKLWSAILAKNMI